MRWLLLLLCLTSSSAFAVDVADEAEFHFRRGLELQRKGKLDDALAEFYASNRLVPNRRVQFNIASCLGQLRLYNEAFRAYSELRRAELSAEEKRDVEAALAFLGPKVALVRVETTPPGATLYVGRKDLGALGTTPKVLALPPGPAPVIVELDGHRPAQAEVTLTRGEEQVLQFDLERIFGHVSLPRIPAGAQVRRDKLDGPILREGPGTVQLVPGRVVLFVTAEGFVPARIEAEVPADGTAELDVPLTPVPPPTAAIVIRANVEGALVRVNGNAVGFTPTVAERVPAGQAVEVEVSKDGRETVRETVRLEENERRFLEVRLAPRRLEIAGATQRAVRLEEAPASVSVITREEIRRLGYTTLAEALRSVRGLYVWNDRLHEGVGIRGFGWAQSNRVLVLLNGHPVNEFTDGRAPLGRDLGVDLSQVERIEVVRGGGMMFASTAFLGLVNVITRTPDEGDHGAAHLTAGTNGLNEARASASHATDEGEVLVTAGLQQRLGEFAYRAPGELPVQGADDERAAQALMVVRRGNFSLMAGASGRTKQAPTAAFGGEAGATSFEESRQFIAAQYQRVFPWRGRLFARMAWDGARSQRLTALPGGGARDGGAVQWVSLEARAERWLSKQHRLTGSVEIRHAFNLSQKVAMTNGTVLRSRTTPERIHAFYAGYEWLPSPRFLLTAGFRFDPLVLVLPASDGTSPNVLEQLAGEFSAAIPMPQLSIVGKPYAKGNTKLLTGLWYRSPSIYERMTADGTGLFIPELRMGVEVEHAHELTDEISLIGNAFLVRYHSVIAREFKEGAVAPTHRNYWNVSSAGVEGELRYSPGDGVLIAAAYAFQRPMQNQAQTPLPNAPQHLGSAKLMAPVVAARLYAATEIVFAGARRDREGVPVDDVFMWNVVLSGDYPAWGLRYYAGVFNLLNERTADPAPREVRERVISAYGREFRAGLGYEF